MSEHQACRTLVKSPPELWSECSDAASLARHLGAFGEIRITRLEPETTVVWEGEQVSGTVRLESSGWGTKVILTARAEGSETSEIPEPEPESPPREPPTEALPPPPRLGPFARVLVWFGFRAEPEPPSGGGGTAQEPEDSRQPEDSQQPEERAAPAAADLSPQEQALRAALTSLGAAHHRPFSRG